jgi:hypothetical protein
MRICAIVKYPPIQGGVAAQTYWMCRALAARGHDVFVVTNAAEVEPAYRIWMFGDDESRLEARFAGGGSVRVRSSHQWDPRQYAHVPARNPAAAKLAAMATARHTTCGAATSGSGPWPGTLPPAPPMTPVSRNRGQSTVSGHLNPAGTMPHGRASAGTV